MDITDHLSTQFNTGELTLIAEQVGLAPVSRWTSRQLIDAICATLDKDGIPEPPGTDIETLPQGVLLLDEFLYLAGYVDDQGNVIKRAAQKLSLEQFMELHQLKSKPDCFEYADDKDPACARCIFYLYCAEARLANLPPCYGVIWLNTDVECQNCIDAPLCKEATLARKQGVK